MNRRYTVYILRHSLHEKSILTHHARVHAEECGKAFAKLDLPTPTLVLCSPAQRCITTTDLFVLGIGIAPKAFHTDPRLADWAADPVDGGEDSVRVLRTEAAMQSVDTEEYLLTSPKYHNRMVERGREGAEAIIEVLNGKYGGQHSVILVGSHGGSRIEVTVAALEGAEDPTRTAMRVARCSVVMLQLEDDETSPGGLRVTKKSYMDNLAAIFAAI